MTEPGNGQSGTFVVSMSSQTAVILKRFHDGAMKQGRGGLFLAAFRFIVQRLRTDPLVFGEELYRLPALKLIVRQAVVSPLVVDYAVDDERPLVFIRGFKILR
jgi:hypothetical protein